MEPTIVKTVPVTLVSATQRLSSSDQLLWDMKIKVPFSQYPIPTAMPYEWGTEESMRVGTQVTARLLRGKLRPGQQGTQDFHWYWEVVGWAGWGQAGELPDALPDALPDDPRFRSKDELRFTEAWHIAVAMAAAGYFQGESPRLEDFEGLAWGVYNSLAGIG